MLTSNNVLESNKEKSLGRNKSRRSDTDSKGGNGKKKKNFKPEAKQTTPFWFRADEDFIAASRRHDDR